MDYRWNLISKQYQFLAGNRPEALMSDHRRFILTRNYLHDKLSITSTRAIAQLGRAPRLHARQCFFRGVHHAINRIDLIEKSMSYSTYSREQENNSLTNIWFGPLWMPI
jgi:hypothetical protein